MMQIVYAQQPIPRDFTKSLFLCGPSPRVPNVPSWRQSALDALDRMAYDGVVFVPELVGGVPDSGLVDGDYLNQIDWEQDGMNHSDVIAFWVPSTKDDFPALTTRVELGMQASSGKVIFGAPGDAFKTRYMESIAPGFRIPVFRTLEDVLSESLRRLEKGYPRIGPETAIPLHLFRTKHFQAWYDAQTMAGHSLEAVHDVHSSFPMGSRGDPFYMQLHLSMKIRGENRVKRNEAVIIRPSISSICAYYKPFFGPPKVVLVREYRIGVMNKDGFVYELPGGSSFDDTEDSLSIASDEFSKEAGLVLPRSRYRYVDTRQLSATTVAHQSHLFVIRLTNEEISRLSELEKKKVHFGEQKDTERTYPVVHTLEKIVAEDTVDSANLGLIFRALKSEKVI